MKIYKFKFVNSDNRVYRVVFHRITIFNNLWGRINDEIKLLNLKNKDKENGETYALDSIERIK